MDKIKSRTVEELFCDGYRVDRIADLIGETVASVVKKLKQSGHDCLAATVENMAPVIIGRQARQLDIIYDWLNKLRENEQISISDFTDINLKIQAREDKIFNIERATKINLNIESDEELKRQFLAEQGIDYDELKPLAKKFEQSEREKK